VTLAADTVEGAPAAAASGAAEPEPEGGGIGPVEPQRAAVAQGAKEEAPAPLSFPGPEAIPPTGVRSVRSAGGGLVTETLAELYLAQGLLERAAEVYRALLAERPGDGRLAARLEEVEKRLAAREVWANPGPAGGAGSEAGGSDARRAGEEPAGAGEPPLAPEPPFTFEPLPALESLFGIEPPSAAGPTSTSEPVPAAVPALAVEPSKAVSPTVESPAAGSPARTVPWAAEPPAAAPAPAQGPAESRSAAWAAEPSAEEDALDAPAALADVLVGLLECRDPAGPGGSGLVRQIALAIGRELGLGRDALRTVALAALLHGVGRLAAGAGRGAEFGAPELEATLALLEGVPLSEGVRAAIAHLADRWDGAGAPAGRPRGEAIPVEARVIAVARAFADLLARAPAEDRPRRVPAALRALEREAGARFDPEAVAALGRVLGRAPAAGQGLAQPVVVLAPDAATATVLSVRLLSAGYRPEPFADAAAARARLGEGAADALVVADDPADAALRLIAGLRADPRHAALPVLVTGADEPRRRIALLGAGADACFPSSTTPAELAAALGAALRRAARAPAGAPAAVARPALEGDLARFSLPWLLDALTFDRRTARVELSTTDDEGSIWLDHGTPVHAETRGQAGEPALQRMLRWREGSFAVELDRPPPAHTLREPLARLLVGSESGGSPWP